MPPILITQCAWSQNDSEVHIKLPLKNVQLSKMNIITTENFLKVNLAPYLFQLVLGGRVEPTKTKCISKNYELIIELTKAVPEMWHSLSQWVDKKNLIEMKQRIISEEHKKVERKSKIKSRETEEKEMTEALFTEGSSYIIQHLPGEILAHKNLVSAYQMSVHQEEKLRIQSEKDQVKSTGLQELLKVKNSFNRGNRSPTLTHSGQELPVPIPLPRTDGTIQFSLSQRVLPTPRRASTKIEEEEWLRKEAEAMRSSGFVPEDLTDEERNPFWLLEKGMIFFKNDNYLAAMNAFSYGSRISPKLPIFYLRLAQTQLKLHRYWRSIENCNKALELLVPIVEQNRCMRAETLRTRGAAYGYLNEPDLSSSDFHSAENLN